MPLLFFDTETTGFVDKDKDLTHEDQPYVLQLAALLDDDEGNTVSAINVILNTESGPVPSGAAGVHGITEEKYKAFGIKPLTALATFNGLAQRATTLVGHNISYDLGMLKIAYAREGKLSNYSDDVGRKPTFCTMQETTDIVKIPNPRSRSGQYKWPKLEEAYRVLVSPDGFEGAHDALADVRATREIFYSLRKGE